jgi:cellulose synthase/poly-beta-1,6-N-acetylglucosamine synthase-like glycosyltransferase
MCIVVYMCVNTTTTPTKPLEIKSQWAWQINCTSFRAWYAGAVLVSILVAFGVFAPVVFVSALLWSFSFFVLFIACLRILALIITMKGIRPSNFTEPPNTKLPTFTILVPLYQEAHMVNELVKHLLSTNYPHNLLDIVLVVEADDKPTCSAVNCDLHHPLRSFMVPPSGPRTKPKALNAALGSTPESRRGDIITVYDAEDRPHPDQLMQAAMAFTADPELAVVQAPLGYYNDKENFLTALFGLEYAALFHVWNPALTRLGIPFTLGGTSNHIRKDILESCGGWDAYNVTEDADLSFRIHALSRAGQTLKMGTIFPPTEEEAVSNVKDWTSQRSRWLKGFMQTWCVHMRFQKHAPDSGGFSWGTRVKNLFSLQITVGATLLAAFLHLPSLLIMTIIYMRSINNVPPSDLLPLLMCTSIVGYGAAILTSMIGALRAGKPHLVKYAILMPFYWLLYFWPALIAAYEIILAPAYWRKTAHVGMRKRKTLVRGKKAISQVLEPANAPPYT